MSYVKKLLEQEVTPFGKMMTVVITSIVMLSLVYVAIAKLQTMKGATEISALEMDRFKEWSTEYKNNTEISSLMKTAIEDDIVTQNEYRNILRKSVELIESIYEKERANNLKEIRANLK